MNIMDIKLQEEPSPFSMLNQLMGVKDRYCFGNEEILVCKSCGSKISAMLSVMTLQEE
jgi:hypothetical protein